MSAFHAALLLSLALGQEGKLPVPKDARLTLQLDRPSYFLGENVLVHFCIENVGGEPFRIDLGGDYRGSPRALRFAVHATDATGREAPDPTPNPNCMGGISYTREIKPGEKHYSSLALMHYRRFDRSGIYRLRVTHDLGWTTSDPSKFPAAVADIELKMPSEKQARQVLEEAYQLPPDQGGMPARSVLPMPTLARSIIQFICPCSLRGPALATSEPARPGDHAHSGGDARTGSPARVSRSRLRARHCKRSMPGSPIRNCRRSCRRVHLSSPTMKPGGAGWSSIPGGRSLPRRSARWGGHCWRRRTSRAWNAGPTWCNAWERPATFPGWPPPWIGPSRRQASAARRNRAIPDRGACDELVRAGACWASRAWWSRSRVPPANSSCLPPPWERSLPSGPLAGRPTWSRPSGTRSPTSVRPHEEPASAAAGRPRQTGASPRRGCRCRCGHCRLSCGGEVEGAPLRRSPPCCALQKAREYWHFNAVNGPPRPWASAENGWTSMVARLDEEKMAPLCLVALLHLVIADLNGYGSRTDLDRPTAVACKKAWQQFLAQRACFSGQARPFSARPLASPSPTCSPASR